MGGGGGSTTNRKYNATDLVNSAVGYNLSPVALYCLHFGKMALFKTFFFFFLSYKQVLFNVALDIKSITGLL